MLFLQQQTQCRWSSWRGSWRRSGARARRTAGSWPRCRCAPVVIAHAGACPGSARSLVRPAGSEPGSREGAGQTAEQGGCPLVRPSASSFGGGWVAGLGCPVNALSTHCPRPPHCLPLPRLLRRRRGGRLPRSRPSGRSCRCVFSSGGCWVGYWVGCWVGGWVRATGEQPPVFALQHHRWHSGAALCLPRRTSATSAVVAWCPAW